MHGPDQCKFLDIMFNIVEAGSQQIKYTANSSPAEGDMGICGVDVFFNAVMQ